MRKGPMILILILCIFNIDRSIANDLLEVGKIIDKKIHYEHLKLSDDSIIVLVQGQDEFTEKYHYLYDKLKVTGHSIFMYDLVGQGFSHGARCYIDNFFTYVNNLHKIITWLKNEKGYKKFYLLSHSAGGLITKLYLAKYHDNKDIVASASTSDYLNIYSTKPYPRAIAYSTAALMTFIGHGKRPVDGVKPFTKDQLTHDDEMFLKFKDHKGHCGVATYGWVYSSLKAHKFIKKKKNYNKIKVPLLILTGTKDTIVNPDKVQKWCQKVKVYNSLSKCVSYDEMYHELLHEIIRDQVVQEIIDFFYRAASAKFPTLNN